MKNVARYLMWTGCVVAGVAAAFGCYINSFSDMDVMQRSVVFLKSAWPFVAGCVTAGVGGLLSLILMFISIWGKRR